MSDAKRWFEEALAERHDLLSPAGRHRRRTLGAELQQAVVRRRHRRRTRRAALGVALVLALLWLGTSLGTPPRSRPNEVAESRSPALPHMDFAEVRNASDVLARFSVPSTPRGDCLIDDAELLRLLAAANRPTGLIRTPDRVLLTAKVTDDLPPPADG